MNHIHTHKVVDKETSVIIKTGTLKDCNAYYDTVPNCYGPQPLEGEEFEMANYVILDDIKNACYAGCREVNPSDPTNAAAAYPEVMKALTTIRAICQNKAIGRDGCTWGDTDFDSMSACAGFNQALENILPHLDIIEKVTKS